MSLFRRSRSLVIGSAIVLSIVGAAVLFLHRQSPAMAGVCNFVDIEEGACGSDQAIAG